MMFATAVFEVNSVKIITTIARMRTKSTIGTPFKKLKYSAIHSESPLALNALDNAIPPPKRSRIPHGILTAHCQFKVNSCLFQETGSMNRSTAPRIAIVQSSIPGKSISKPGITNSPMSLDARKIHAIATRTKTKRVFFSPRLIVPIDSISR